MLSYSRGGIVPNKPCVICHLRAKVSWLIRMGEMESLQSKWADCSPVTFLPFPPS